MTSRRFDRFAIRAVLVAAFACAAGAAMLFAQQEMRIQMNQQTITSGGPGGVQFNAPVLATGTGLIVGQVVDAGTDKPVAGAIVNIGGSGAGGRGGGGAMIGFASSGGPLTLGGPADPNAVPRVITDADGHFVFRNLPKGSFNINATRVGYIDGSYGRLRPAGSSQTLDLDDGQRVSDVKVRVFRYASVSGTVVDDLGEPAVGVTVRAYKRAVVGGKRLLGTSGIATQTDDRGMYRLGMLMPGDYVIGVPTVQTSMPAGTNGPLGGLGPDVLSTMMSGSGSISLNFGAGSQVTSDPRFLLSTSGAPFSTDPSGKLLVYPSQYFPNTAAASQAENITLISGDDRSGVDMQLKLVPTSNVGGRLIGPDGPASGFALHLVSAESGLMSGDPDVATAITNTAGEFMFLGVPAGSYTVETVRVPRGQGVTQMFAGGGGTMMFTTTINTVGGRGGPPAPTQPTLWIETPLSVGGDVNNLTLSLREGLSLSGKFQFEGAAQQPTGDDFQTITMVAESADGRTHLPTVTGRGDPKGTFTINGLLPGKYLLRAAGAPRGWSFKNATMGGTDVSDVGVDVGEHEITGIAVTFSDQTSALSGNVKNADGAPDSAAAVVVFPADNRSWENYGSNPRRMRTVRTTKTGAYTIPALPAGDYFVAAIKEELSGDWQDPRMLDQISRGATRLSIGDADKHNQDLTTANLRPLSNGGEAPAAATELSFDAPRPHGPYVETADDADAIGVEPQRGQGAAPPPQRDSRNDAQAAARDKSSAPETGSGVVSGLVTLEDGATPVRRAKVSLRNTDSRTERIAITDDGGRFSMSSLAPGHYSLTATKPPFLTGYYGSKHPGRGPSTPLSVVNGQTVGNLKLQIAKGGVISGTVRDEFGAPVAMASIRLMQYRTVNGTRQLVGVAAQNVQTDDRGDYRAYGLDPGAYAVSVSPANAVIGGVELRRLSAQDVSQALAEARQPSAGPPPANTGAMAGSSLAPANRDTIGRTVGFATVYYPGAVSATDAGTVNLAAGQEANGIDISVRLVPMSRVEGTLVGPDGQPYSGGSVLAMPRGTDGMFGSIMAARSGADGSFTITNVPPGPYTLTSRTGNGPVMSYRMTAPMAVSGMMMAPPPPPPPPPPPGTSTAPTSAPSYWASQDIDVSGQNLTGLQLTLQEGLTVSGRVAFTGKTPPPSLGNVRIGLTPDATSGMSFALPLTPVAADGTFSLTGIPPGKYHVATNFSVGAPAAGGGALNLWSARSGVLDGVDVLDRGIDVRPGRPVQNLVISFTDQPTSISGKLIDASGAPVPDLTIVVFSTDRGDWTPGSRRVSQPIRPANDGKLLDDRPAAGRVLPGGAHGHRAG